MAVPEAECATTLRYGRRKMDPAVLQHLQRKALIAAKRLDTHFIDQFGEPPDI
jgi:hypothetical protein